MPYSPEAYLQETGRAGRDGRPVEATLLYSAADLDFTAALAPSHGNPSAESREIGPRARLAAERYNQILGYALNTERCRREQLLGFLGHELARCSGCDVCRGGTLQRPEGEPQILDFLSKNRKRFTLHQTVHLLRGARSYSVVRASLASYRGFGLLAGWQEEEIEEALESLRRSREIKVLKRGFWKDRVTMGEAFAMKSRN